MTHDELMAALERDYRRVYAARDELKMAEGALALTKELVREMNEKGWPE